MGYATTKDSFIQIPRHAAALLEQREAERVGRHLQNRIGRYITGVQRSVTTMASNGDLAGSVNSGCEESKPASCDWAGPSPPQTPTGVPFACLQDYKA